jgi:hypothetical protein
VGGQRIQQLPANEPARLLRLVDQRGGQQAGGEQAAAGALVVVGR